MRLATGLALAMLIAAPLLALHGQRAQAQAQPDPDPQPPPGDRGQGQQAQGDAESSEATAHEGPQGEDVDAASEAQGAEADTAGTDERPGANADSAGSDDSASARYFLDHEFLGTYCPGRIGSVDAPRILHVDETYGADHSFTVSYGADEIRRGFPRITGGHWEFVSFSYDQTGWHVYVDVRTDQLPTRRIELWMRRSNGAVSATDYLTQPIPPYPARRVVKCA